mmetsp:Transcript_5866/g.19650  ORF Transcript_5866/g.19650 Transcript_5866/m.19650 type:complete len:328 (+) Transcript_5866:930-1913(+)
MESQRALPAKLAHRGDNLSLSPGAHLCQPRQQPGRQPHSRWDRCRRRPRGSDFGHSPLDRAEGGRATWPPRDPRRRLARRGPHHLHRRPSRRTAVVRREAGAQLWSCRGERQDPERLAWICREDRAKAFGPAHPLLDRARGQPERCDAHAALPQRGQLQRRAAGRPGPAGAQRQAEDRHGARERPGPRRLPLLEVFRSHPAGAHRRRTLQGPRALVLPGAPPPGVARASGKGPRRDSRSVGQRRKDEPPLGQHRQAWQPARSRDQPPQLCDDNHRGRRLWRRGDGLGGLGGVRGLGAGGAGACLGGRRLPRRRPTWVWVHIRRALSQ